jgi:hypothetical protein
LGGWGVILRVGGGAPNVGHAVLARRSFVPLSIKIVFRRAPWCPPPPPSRYAKGIVDETHLFWKRLVAERGNAAVVG